MDRPRLCQQVKVSVLCLYKLQFLHINWSRLCQQVKVSACLQVTVSAHKQAQAVSTSESFCIPLTGRKASNGSLGR